MPLSNFSLYHLLQTEKTFLYFVKIANALFDYFCAKEKTGKRILIFQYSP